MMITGEFEKEQGIKGSNVMPAIKSSVMARKSVLPSQIKATKHCAVHAQLSLKKNWRKTKMSNALMTKPVSFEVNGEDVRLTGETVKNYLVRGNGDVTDQELVMFINLCKYQKLNPFLNEAYLVKFGDQPAQIITSKEAFMKRAENHPKYEGFEAGIIVERNGELVEIEGAVKLSKDKLIGGWAKVYRSDRKVPVSVRISLEEFSKGQATWNQMPLNMIRKSAIVNAQREAFPDTLGALYTEDDAEVVNSDESSATQEIKQNANKEELDFNNEAVQDVSYQEVEKNEPVQGQSNINGSAKRHQGKQNQPNLFNHQQSEPDF